MILSVITGILALKYKGFLTFIFIYFLFYCVDVFFFEFDQLFQLFFSLLLYVLDLLFSPLNFRFVWKITSIFIMTICILSFFIAFFNIFFKLTIYFLNMVKLLTISFLFQSQPHFHHYRSFELF